MVGIWSDMHNAMIRVLAQFLCDIGRIELRDLRKSVKSCLRGTRCLL